MNAEDKCLAYDCFFPRNGVKLEIPPHRHTVHALFADTIQSNRRFSVALESETHKLARAEIQSKITHYQVATGGPAANEQQ